VSTTPETLTEGKKDTKKTREKNRALAKIGLNQGSLETGVREDLAGKEDGGGLGGGGGTRGGGGAGPPPPFLGERGMSFLLL